jgi:hypothetical protein
MREIREELLSQILVKVKYYFIDFLVFLCYYDFGGFHPSWLMVAHWAMICLLLK